MTDHQPYEVLCALAATGQLSAAERASFDAHCMHCAACRCQLQDLISIGLQLQLDGAIHATAAPMAAGSLERFRARAVREGIVLCPAPVRPSPSLGLTTAAAVFVIIAALLFPSDGRKAPERLAMSATPTLIQHSVPASVIRRKSTPQPSKPIRVRLVRRRFVPHSDIEGNHSGLTTQRFPWVIMASYPFFGSDNTTKSLPAGYPALSRSQISRLNIFPRLTGANSTDVASIGTSNRAVDIALTGKPFDFTRNIRQISFQLPTAQ